jgi:kynurenine formamidase
MHAEAGGREGEGRDRVAVGNGRFRLIGFPLRIRGGTASPIRAVAMFEG